MIARLVGRFWRWHNGRDDPDAVVRCLNCRREVLRRELYFGGCCSRACSEEYGDLLAY